MTEQYRIPMTSAILMAMGAQPDNGTFLLHGFRFQDLGENWLMRYGAHDGLVINYVDQMLTCAYRSGEHDGKAEIEAYKITSYDEGFRQGKTIGANETRTGYDEGRTHGYREGYDEGRTHGYNTGYIDGQKNGHLEGKKVGYVEGQKDGYVEGRKAGYEEGKQAGYDEGKQAEYAERERGQVDAYNNGLRDGKAITNAEGISAWGHEREIANEKRKSYEFGLIEGARRADTAAAIQAYEKGVAHGREKGYSEGLQAGIEQGRLTGVAVGALIERLKG